MNKYFHIIKNLIIAIIIEVIVFNITSYRILFGNFEKKELKEFNFLYNQDGKAFSAISSLKNFISDPTGIINVNMDNKISTDNSWYTLQGIKLQGEPQQKGLYIYQGKKIIKR